MGALVGFSWRRAGARREDPPVEGAATAAVAHEDAGVAVVDNTLRRSAILSLSPLEAVQLTVCSSN